MTFQEKFEQWPEPYQPPFSEIKEIGCCNEHEEEFNWYRNHRWQELKDLILSREEILEHQIDPLQFGSLKERVHRYFMKGFLSSLAEKTEKSESFDEIKDWDWTWVTEIKYQLKKPSQPDDTLPPYSKEELENIVELLEFIQQKFTLDPENLSYRGDKEIKDTLENWKSYLAENYSEKN